MKFEKVKLNQLIPSEYNPRIITPDEQKRLAENLKEFGVVDPIIVNLKNNHIIGGHQRYNVLSKLSDEEKEFSMIRLGDIGWVFDSDKLTIKDENHEKALNLALNKISGEWDYDKLTVLLDDLQVSNFNMDLTGFDEIEINSFNINTNFQENKEPLSSEKMFESNSFQEEPINTDNNTDENTQDTSETNEFPEVKETSFKEFYVLEVELPSEKELEQVYNKMVEEGYKCRVLTL